MDKKITTQSATILSFEWKLFYNSFTQRRWRASAQTHISFKHSFEQHRTKRVLWSLYCTLWRAFIPINKTSSQKSFYTHLHFDRWSGWLPLLSSKEALVRAAYCSINLKVVFEMMKYYFNGNAFGVVHT